jgi:hypothetical protein
MVLAIILFIYSCLCLYLGGWNRAKFECIIIFDSLKIWYGDDYSKETFFNKDKDTNKDGKRSWFELTFPDDGGHRLKRYEMLFYGLASSLFAASLWVAALPIIYTIAIAVSYAPIYFAITGYGFVLGFKKYRL